MLSVAVIRQDEFLQEIVAAQGFEIGTSVHRMRISFDGAVPSPAVPDGAAYGAGPSTNRVAGRRTPY